MARGIGFVSSRRAEESIASNLAVRENIYMNPAASGKGVLEFIPRATELSEASAAATRFSIKAAGVEEPVGDAVRRKPAKGGGRALDGGACQAAYS